MSGAMRSPTISAARPRLQASSAISGAPEPARRRGPSPRSLTASSLDAKRGIRKMPPSAWKAAKKTWPCRASTATTTVPDASSRMSGAANAASVDTPTAGMPQASAMARAALIPTRSPVNEPGPTVTAMRSSAAKPPSIRPTTRSMSGISASAWPRSMPRVSDDSAAVAPSLRTQAETAGRAVSIARILIVATLTALRVPIN